MTPHIFMRIAINPALSLLPPEMTSPAAKALMLTIALQESRLEHRRQIGGPARGFWQFEVNGTLGVLNHDKSRTLALQSLKLLGYQDVFAEEVHPLLEHNDVLAAIFARLLLWTLPMPLPVRRRVSEGWDQYLEAWRPGRPHPGTWGENWQDAWEALLA